MFPFTDEYTKDKQVKTCPDSQVHPRIQMLRLQSQFSFCCSLLTHNETIVYKSMGNALGLNTVLSNLDKCNHSETNFKFSIALKSQPLKHIQTYHMLHSERTVGNYAPPTVDICLLHVVCYKSPTSCHREKRVSQSTKCYVALYLLSYGKKNSVVLCHVSDS